MPYMAAVTSQQETGQLQAGASPAPGVHGLAQWGRSWISATTHPLSQAWPVWLYAVWLQCHF